MTSRLLALALIISLAAGCGPTPEKGKARKLNSETTDSSARQEPKKETSAQVKKADEPKKETVAPVKKPNPEVKATTEAGIIRGRVRWEGPIPETTPSAEPRLVLVNRQPVQAPVVSAINPETKGLADVMVWVENVDAKVCPPREGPAVLTQVRGVYRPRAQFASVGAKLEVRTTDDEADFQGSGLKFSRSMKRGEKARPVALTSARVITIHSDALSWMEPAYVSVLNHGCHAVTGKDGAFELPKLPPGEYEVHMWPVGRMGKTGKGRLVMHKKVTVGEDKGANIEWAVTASSAE